MQTRRLRQMVSGLRRSRGAPVWSASSLTLPTGFTFTRSGAAYGLYGSTFAAALLASYATDTPRLDRLENEAVGLLMEAARTNTNPQSEDFATTWILAGSTISANAIAAPDGASTADKIVETSATSVHEAHVNCGAVVSGTVYTLSVFLKAGERTAAQLVPSLTPGGNSGAIVNLANGTVTTVAGTASGVSGIRALGNGWYRVWHTFTAQSSVSCSMFVECQTSTGAGLHTTYAGSAGSGIYAWGAQFEAGAFPTAYIPTAGSSVTRNAETASGAVTISAAGFAVRLKARAAFGKTGDQYLWQVDDGTAGNRCTIRRNSSGAIVAEVVTASSTVAQITMGTVADGAEFVVAATFAANSVNAALNGSAGTRDTSCAMPAVTTQRWGTDHAGANQFSGWIVEAPGSGVSWRPAISSDVALGALAT